MWETHEQDRDRFYVTNPVGHVSTGISYPGRSLCLRDPNLSSPPLQSSFYHHRSAAADRRGPPPPCPFPISGRRPGPPASIPLPVSQIPTRSTPSADLAFDAPLRYRRRAPSPPPTADPHRPPSSPSVREAPQISQISNRRRSPVRETPSPPLFAKPHPRPRRPLSLLPFADPNAPPSVQIRAALALLVRRSGSTGIARSCATLPSIARPRHQNRTTTHDRATFETIPRRRPSPPPFEDPLAAFNLYHYGDSRGPPDPPRPNLPFNRSERRRPSPPPFEDPLAAFNLYHYGDSRGPPNPRRPDPPFRRSEPTPPTPPEPDYWKEAEDEFVSSVMARYDAFVAADKAARALASSRAPPSTVSITPVSAPLPKPVSATEPASSASTLPALVSVAIPSPAVTSTIVVLAPAPIDKPASAPIAKIGTDPVPFQICVGPCRVAPFVPPTSDVSMIRGRIVFKKGRMIPYIIGPNGGRARPPRARLKD